MHKLNIVVVALGAASLPIVAHRDAYTAIAGIRSDDVHGTYAVATGIARQTPPESWAPQDPADGIWRAGRAAINASEWSKAAEQFRRIRTDNALRSSVYRGPAHYWEAYARAQMGGSAQLRQAQSLLTTLQEDFPETAREIRDAASLLATVEGRLSREYGDQGSAARLTEAARAADGCPDMDDDNNPQVAALNALLQMNSDVAMPLLEKLIADRGKCSAGMRARAMWLIAQQQSPRAAEILLQAAKSDPDMEVREQAVFWLSQVDSDKAVDALESILRSNASAELHENALFAMSQNRSPRATAVLREYATRQDISAETRAVAIHWLGQGGGAENVAFLRDLFGKVQDAESKEQILFAMSQSRTPETSQWFINMFSDEKQDIEIRKQALFWYAQGGPDDDARPRANAAELVRLYDRMTDVEMKQQLIFVMSQKGGQKDYVDKLMDIAKNDRNPELRTQAIFWLGQVGSKDPRVAKFLMDLING
ncbi:MAG TPA: HEAT repeat domain-containing protein [Longimicrobiales bacterium]